MSGPSEPAATPTASVSPRDRALRVLGLEPDASEDARVSRYWRLRAHIEARAVSSRDADFIRARERELAQLTAAFEFGAGAAPAAVPRLEIAAASREIRDEGAAVRLRALRIWAVAATGISLLLGALLFVGSGRPTERSPAGGREPARLRVRAEPAGALLEILGTEDGRTIARGPADGTPHALAPGAYRLRVSADACPDDWALDAQLTAGEDRSYEPRICRGRGDLVVRSNVTEDRVRIDGKDVGSSSELPHPVSVGDHQVEVTKPGYVPWHGEVRIRPEQELELMAELTRQPESQPSSPSPPPASSPRSPKTARLPAAAPSEGPREAGKPPQPPAPAPLDAPTAGSALMSAPGGSKSWHDLVRRQLLAQYDANHSQSLDDPEEIQSVPCAQWRAIENSYETGGLALPMTRLYGFDGSEAPANTLGVTRGMRAFAYERMQECGLRPAS